MDYKCLCLKYFRILFTVAIFIIELPSSCAVRGGASKSTLSLSSHKSASTQFFPANSPKKTLRRTNRERFLAKEIGKLKVEQVEQMVEPKYSAMTKPLQNVTSKLGMIGKKAEMASQLDLKTVREAKKWLATEGQSPGAAIRDAKSALPALEKVVQEHSLGDYLDALEKSKTLKFEVDDSRGYKRAKRWKDLSEDVRKTIIEKQVKKRNLPLKKAEAEAMKLYDDKALKFNKIADYEAYRRSVLTSAKRDIDRAPEIWKQHLPRAKKALEKREKELIETHERELKTSREATKELKGQQYKTTENPISRYSLLEKQARKAAKEDVEQLQMEQYVTVKNPISTGNKPDSRARGFEAPRQFQVG